MPKVSEAHRQARRNQILDAAAACFARRGFHQATMQDICRQAELSPGALYRYFRSKEEIIEAMADQHRERNAAFIEGARQHGETLAIVEELAQVFFGMLANNDACSLDIEVWGEARRNPRIMEICRRSLEAVHGPFTQIVRRAQDRGEFSRDLDAESVARVMISFFDGLVVQKAIHPEIDVWKYVAVMKRMVGGTFWTGDNKS